MTINNGPYQHEAEAMAQPMPREVRALHDAGRVRSGDPHRLVRDLRTRHLVQACAESDVELGMFDQRTLSWLAGWEDSTVQVVIGLVRRAYEAGWRAAVEQDGA